MSLPILDMVGKKFGKLTVLENAGKNKYDLIMWKCICDCGNIHVSSGTSLRRNGVKSCGCLISETSYNRTINQIKNKHMSWKGYNDISGGHFTRIKHSAKNRKIPFDITIKYMWDIFIKQNKKCAISGVELSFNERQKTYNGNASLDRIDSSKGYIKGNIQWIDKNLQHVKLDMPETVFFKWIKTIYEYRGLSNDFEVVHSIDEQTVQEIQSLSQM